MKKILLLGLLLIPSPLFAQQHPCDIATPSSETITSGTRTVGWCHPGRDTEGNSITIVSWNIYINGNVNSLVASFNEIPNSTGLYYFYAPVNFTPGTHIITISAVSSIGEGIPTPQFTVNVNLAGAIPVAPTRIRIGQ